MKYTVIESYNLIPFNKEVNRMIKCGWRTLGGVSVTTDTTGLMSTKTTYYQAMEKSND